jgi:hypothetical protein
MLNPSDNIAFDSVAIDGAGRAGFWMMGDFANLTGTVSVSGSPEACGRSPYMPTSLTQPGGGTLAINGATLAPGDVATTCAPVANF